MKLFTIILVRYTTICILNLEVENPFRHRTVVWCCYMLALWQKKKNDIKRWKRGRSTKCNNFMCTVCMVEVSCCSPYMKSCFWVLSKKVFYEHDVFSYILERNTTQYCLICLLVESPSFHPILLKVEKVEMKCVGFEVLDLVTFMRIYCNFKYMKHRVLQRYKRNFNNKIYKK